jgi:hypothetical protein
VRLSGFGLPVVHSRRDGHPVPADRIFLHTVRVFGYDCRVNKSGPGGCGSSPEAVANLTWRLT